MSRSFLETIKVVDREVYNLEYHQKRYERVLKSLGSEDIKVLREHINPPPASIGIYRCRVVYTRDTLEVSYHKYEKRNIDSLKLIYADELEYSKKSTSREMLDRLFDKREECDDILIVKNSLVCDTSIANVAFFRDGLWYTPAKPLLEGTTRERYLDSGKIIPIDIAVDDLKNYTKIALLNAMIDFAIITKYKLKDIIC